MQVIKGTVSNADGLPEPPSREAIDLLLKQLAAEQATLASYEKIRNETDNCQTEFLCGIKYNHAGGQITIARANIEKIKGQILEAERIYATANEEYRKTLLARGQSDPEVIKLLAQSSLNSISATNKKYLIIGLIVVLVLAVGGFIWYRIKVKKG